MMDIFPATPKDARCFFGYYDKCPWDERSEYLLFHRVAFQDRPPRADDKALVCVTETANGRTDVIGETPAWNFQQGAMLQWLPGRRVLFNDRIEGRFVSRIVDLQSGKQRALPLPVSAVNPAGTLAVSFNFSRLAVWRPGYGYEGVPDPFADQNWPVDDGIYLLDLETGKYSLIIPLARMLDYIKDPEITEYCGRFNHALFSPDGRRFIFLCRWKKDFRDVLAGTTRIFTSSLDGKDLCDLVATDLISHFDWRNNCEIIAYGEYDGEYGFRLIEDRTGRIAPVSPHIQPGDGHCSYSSDEKRILLDTYPMDGYRHLSIFDVDTERTIDLGRYLTVTGEKDIPEIRCDLHPRWSRDEKSVSFDSLHEGYRRVYTVVL